MYRKLLTYSAIVLIAIAGGPILFAQSETPAAFVGFVDEDKNGINDIFADADGDGINDVSGQSYPHSFKFKDDDNNGLNDLWQDADGDGVNDLLWELHQKNKRWVDRNGDGILDEEVSLPRGKKLMAHVLDEDNDKLNDITGEKYTGNDIRGYRFGNIDEERGICDYQFVDEDNDGMNDHFVLPDRARGMRYRNMDVFIDVDGDGIADDRGLNKFQNRGKAKGKTKGKN